MPKNEGPSRLEQDIQSYVARYLPIFLGHAVGTYKAFTIGKIVDQNTFAAHHAACKTAIGHIAMLVKLASSLRLPDSSDAHQQALKALIADAQNELNDYGPVDHDIC